MADQLSARTVAGGIVPQLWSLQVAAALDSFILPLEQICRVERAALGDTINIPVRTLPDASGLSETDTAAADLVDYSPVQPTVQEVVDRVKVSRQLWELSNIDIKSDIVRGLSEKVGIYITKLVTDLYPSFATITGTTNTDLTLTGFMKAAGTMVAAGVPRSELVAVLAPVPMQELLVSCAGTAAFNEFGGEKLPTVGGVPVFEANTVLSDGTDYGNFMGSKNRAIALGMWGAPKVDIQYAQDGTRGYYVEVSQMANSIELIDLAGSWLKSDGD